MNKFILPAVILLLLLGVGGFLFMNSQNKPQQATTTGNVQTNQQPDQNVFTSIKDALSKSLTLECTYSINGVDAKTYIKGGAVRVSTKHASDPKQSGENIMKDKKMYMWNEASKTGFIYTLPDETSLTPLPTTSKTVGSQGQDGSEKSSSVLEQIEKFKDSCKPAVVDDSLFTPPADVKFQDMSAMMNQVQDQMKKVQDDQSVDSEQIKKLMEQYGGASQ